MYIVGMDRQQRFEAKFTVNEENGCWEWAGAKARGYGIFDGQGAHRMALRIYQGLEPGGLHVCHKCDNRACVNPAHLFTGTRSDNMRDMVSKGRMNPSQIAGLLTMGRRFKPGNVPKNRRLSPEDVETIRASRDVPYRELCERFKVCKQTVHKIWKGTRWKTH
jgi:Autographiviridae endonuclease